ncbi:MAG TPA: DNA polymerase III subunit delta [Firmicutes bacterium]|nr:DNA polymerase III subunit delta [Bacillota bacterium]
MIALDANEAKRKWQQGQVGPLYLITGKEWALMDELVALVKQTLLPEGMMDLNCHRFGGDSGAIQAAVEALAPVPFLAERRLAIVAHPVLLAGDNAPEDEQALLTFLEHHPPHACLLLVAPDDGVDKRRRAFRVLQKAGLVVSCNPLTGRDLLDWVKEQADNLGVALSATNARRFLSLMGSNDMGLLRNELAKAAAFVGDGGEVTEQVLVKTVSAHPEAKIFRLVDAIGQRQAGRAMDELMLLLNQEPPLRILFMVARQARLIWQARAGQEVGLTERQLQAQLGVQPFVMAELIKQSKLFSRQELLAGINELWEADRAMKSGRGEQRIILETVVLRLCEQR